MNWRRRQARTGVAGWFVAMSPLLARKLMVGYTGNGPFVLRYGCNRGLLDNGDKPCISFAGPGLDEAIAKEIRSGRGGTCCSRGGAVLASTHEGLQQDQVFPGSAAQRSGGSEICSTPRFQTVRTWLIRKTVW